MATAFVRATYVVPTGFTGLGQPPVNTNLKVHVLISGSNVPWDLTINDQEQTFSLPNNYTAHDVRDKIKVAVANVESQLGITADRTVIADGV